VRHEALLFRMEVEDLDLSAAAAAGVKLEEVRAGGRR
jgi:hypothetical protein